MNNPTHHSDVFKVSKWLCAEHDVSKLQTSKKAKTFQSLNMHFNTERHSQSHTVNVVKKSPKPS